MTVVVLLAGCSGLISGNGPTTREPTATAPATPATGEGGTATSTPVAGTSTSRPTVTPSPVATTSPTPEIESLSATPTVPPNLDPVSAVPPPPGLDGRNLSDPQALLESHNETLRGKTYRVVRRWNDTSGAHGGTVIRTGDDALFVTFWRPATNESTDYYFGEEGIAIRYYSSGRILYGSGASNVGYIAAMSSAFLYRVTPRYIEGYEWRAVGSRTVDGEDQVVFVTNGSYSTENGSAQTDSGSVSPGVRGVMVVSSDGVIRNVHLTSREQSSELTANVIIKHRLTGLGETSVSHPDWFDRIPRINASLTEENRLLVVNHTGGAPIESETTLTVSSSSRTNVTLDRRVTAGDTVYFYRTGTGTDRSLETSINDRPTLTDAAVPFSGHVIVRGNQSSVLFETGVEVESTE